MKLFRRRFLHLALGGVALPAASRGAMAQTYPARSITMIVPYAAGGPVDTLARFLAERMRAPLGQRQNQGLFAFTGRSRLAAAPKVPTTAEAGLPDFTCSIWNAIWAPKSTPKTIITKLNAAVTNVLADAATRQQLASLGSWNRHVSSGVLRTAG